MDLLAKALKAKTREDTIALTQDFLKTRQTRRNSAGLSRNLIDFERQREWVEGIGRYAELSTYRLAEHTDYSTIQEKFNLSNFNNYEKFDQRWMREIGEFKRLANDASERRFYYTGMAQAVLLDRLASGWQTELFEPGVWLEDILAETMSIETKTESRQLFPKILLVMR